jgi:hypothetical protein
VADTANFRDFTKKRPDIYFLLNGDRFDCRKALTPKKLQLAMRSFKSIKAEFDAVKDEGLDSDNTPDLISKISAVLVHFLKPESYQRFELMINEDEPDEPVDIQQLMEILQWVLESIAGRPTTPSPESTDSSPSDGTGTSLTAGAQLEASTLLR